MSSLAASRADNFYFPPEWRPEFGGISKFAGSKGANQYEQKGIIRFEMPMDGWCLHCGQHLAKGLRFNAKKDKDGKYFSTQIWAFTMKCFACSETLIIKTDPENDTYSFAEGLRKHEQEYDPEDEDNLVIMTDERTRQQLRTDPMFRMQQESENRVKVLTETERIQSLANIKDLQFKDDYKSNSLLRQRHRSDRKVAKQQIKEGKKRGLSMPLLNTSEEDKSAAKQAIFKSDLMNNYKIKEKSVFGKIKTESIFEKSQESNNKKRTLSSNNVERVSDKRQNILSKQSIVKIDPKNFLFSCNNNSNIVGSKDSLIKGSHIIRKPKLKENQHSVKEEILNNGLQLISDYNDE
eukprot:gene8922-12032_t